MFHASETFMRGKKTLEPATEDEIEKFLCDIRKLSKILGPCERQIRNYVREGMPRRPDGRFYLPVAVRWHERYVENGLMRYWD